MSKQLPHSIESEQALIWSIMISPNIIWDIDLKQEDFYNDTTWRLFEAMKHLFYKWVKIDILTISDFLKNKWVLDKIWWVSYLMELVEACHHTSHYLSYVNIIKEKSNRRKIIQYGREMEMLWFNEETEINKSVSKIKDIYELSIKQNTKAGYDIIALTNSFEDDRNKYKDKWWFWETSPYDVIDKYTWWIKPWFVYMITAYSNVWKSNFSYTYVVDMLKKWKKVILFSLEVSYNKLFRHIVRAYYNKTEKEIMSDDFFFDMSHFENLTIYDNVYQLQEIENLTRYHKPDCIFIDFVQNIRCEWSSEYERMSKVAIDLQLLTIELNIITFNISQANNEWRNAGADKIQPRWSWALFQSSDVIIWLSREDRLLRLHLIKVKDWVADIWFLVNPDFARLKFNVSESEELKESKINLDF